MLVSGFMPFWMIRTCPYLYFHSCKPQKWRK